MTRDATGAQEEDDGWDFKLSAEEMRKFQEALREIAKHPDRFLRLMRRRAGRLRYDRRNRGCNREGSEGGGEAVLRASGSRLPLDHQTMTSPHNDPTAPHLDTITRVRQAAELKALWAFTALAASTCGMNNCNCPTAPLVRQALKDLTSNDR